jgi:hypothetical protein
MKPHTRACLAGAVTLLRFKSNLCAASVIREAIKALLEEVVYIFFIKKLNLTL